MAKRNLTRRQSWRIQKIQNERSARADRRADRAEESLLGGDLGAEQQGLVIAHFGVQVDVETLDGPERGQVRRCHRRANLPALVTGDRVVWRADNQQSGVIVALQPRRTELYRPDHRGQLKPVAANVDRLVVVSSVAAPAPAVCAAASLSRSWADCRCASAACRGIVDECWFVLVVIVMFWPMRTAVPSAEAASRPLAPRPS